MAEKVNLVSLAEAKQLLEKAKKERGELNEQQKQALYHAEKFAKLSLEKTKKLIEDLLKIEWIEEPFAYMIADLLPTHEDDVRLIFAKARTTPKQEQIQQILQVISSYLK
jgi:DNA-directed RNA polymerase subunit F